MNKVLDVKVVAMNAMITAVYAILTIVCASISYGAINLRISEVIVFLAFFNKKYIPGLVMGCFLANLASPMGIYDVIFGTLATVLVCFAMYHLKNLYMGAIAGGVINGIIVGAELYWVLDLSFVINAFYVFVGETIVLVIGAMIFQLLQKNTTFMQKYINE